MFQTLLFLHLCAVAMLFAGLGMEIAAFVNLHRATTVADVRAATANVPIIGPLMGAGTALLIAMGLGMVYFAGFGWQPWTVVALAVAIALSITGSQVNGKRTEAIRELALHAPDGPITAKLRAARADRLLNYSLASMVTELLAVLYLMSGKPPLASCLVAVVLAALVPVVPVLRWVRPEQLVVVPAER